MTDDAEDGVSAGRGAPAVQASGNAARLMPARGVNVWLRVGRLLDGESNQAIENADVVYGAEAIRFVGAGGALPPRDLLRTGQTRPDLEMPSHTLLPGLIDAHTHLFLDGAELDPEKRRALLKSSPAELLASALERLEPLVRMGIAGVRDAGDRHGVGLALSRRYRSDERGVMPYVDSPGAAIHRKGHYGGFMSEPLEAFESPEACVADRLHRGADRIKLIATGIIDFTEGRVPRPPQLSTMDVSRLVDAARSQGRQTFAHASGEEGISNAISGGVDSIEHGYFVSFDHLAAMRDGNVAWVATFAPLRAQIDHAGIIGWDGKVVSNLERILERHAVSLLKASEMGVRVIAGSDSGSMGVVHGEGLLDEMTMLRQAGLSAEAVINAATGGSSGRLGFHEGIGRVKSGYRPRMILINKVGELEIDDLRRPEYVIFDGVVYTAEWAK